MDIELQAELLKLKGYLNEINHISYTYAQMGRSNPMNAMNDNKARQMIKIYNDLLIKVKNLILNYENTNIVS